MKAVSICWYRIDEIIFIWLPSSPSSLFHTYYSLATILSIRLKNVLARFHKQFAPIVSPTPTTGGGGMGMGMTIPGMSAMTGSNSNAHNAHNANTMNNNNLSGNTDGKN